MGRMLTKFSVAATMLGLVAAACGGVAPAASPTTAPATAAPVAATTAPAATPGPPIKIAALTSLTGPFAPWGAKVRAGMQFAAQELNAAGGVNGRNIEIVERDDKNNADSAVTDFRELIERQGIVAAAGVISSDVALAAARVAESEKVPLFLTMAGSDAILKKTSRYTFRTCLMAATMDIGPIAAFIKDKKYTRVGALIADYAWGRAIEAAIKKDVETIPGVKVQYEVAPVPERDFTPYVRRLQAFNPQVLILTGHPPGNFATTKVALELGVGEFMTGSWSPPETWVAQAGKAMFGKVVEGSCADWGSADYQKLAKSFYDSQKSFFDHSAFSGYTTVKLVADAIKRTGKADRAAIADAIRTGKFVQPGYAFPLSFTEWGELKEATPVLYTFAEGDPPGGSNPGAGWQPKVLLKSPAIKPFEPAN